MLPAYWRKLLDKNVGEGLGRRLMSQTSGGLYERFFEEVGKPVDLEAGAAHL
jgi:hypothetical protein